MSTSIYFNDWKRVRLLEKEKRDEQSQKLGQLALKATRVLIHILLAVFVLTSGLVSKGTILYITNQAGYFEKNTKQTEENWIWLVIFAVSSASVIEFLRCLCNLIFRQTPTPSIMHFLVALLFTTLEAGGTGIFVFGIFTRLDLIRSILIMNGISYFPATLKLLQICIVKSGNVSDDSDDKSNQQNNVYKRVSQNRILNFAFKLALALMQYSVFFLVLFTEFESIELWQLLIGILLVSIGMSRNFFSFNQPQTDGLVGKLNQFFRGMEVARVKIGIISNLWRIGVIVLIAHIYFPSFVSTQTLFGISRSYPSQLDYFWPFLAHFSSSIAFYLASSLSFKLRMHRLCFALPTTFITPVALIIACSLCEINPVNASNQFKEYFKCKRFAASTSAYKTQFIIGVSLWWASYLIINAHVWKKYLQIEVSKFTRPFKFQYFNSVFAEHSLLFNSINKMSGTNQYLNDEKSIDDDKRSDTVLYVCATIWHENNNEMLQLLKSLMRLDDDQRSSTSPSYECEMHVFFDDAIYNSNVTGCSEPNEFVRNFIHLVEEAASFTHKRREKLKPPSKSSTPYGGRLTFEMPAGNLLVVHLKDKAKIRNKKRWSQVMYMYYLLGYKYFGDLHIMEKLYAADTSHKTKNKTNEFTGFGNLLNNLDPILRQKLENTFILTLDGDVEFRPNAVRLMVDKIKENKRLGSVCGRVHPIGAGPMVWYQYFEYAVGHWLKKVSEHIFGTVMCSPGCFSLLRGSTLLEDQILPIYVAKSSEASEYVQYDQGEDRWLSTLIIQQGYYIAYCSAADSMTYSPETFHEYYNQRRRWIPSTMANLIDFLKDYRHILKVNSRITLFFIAYVLLNFVASLLGPSTVLLMIADTLQVGFGLNVWLAYFLAIAPAVAYAIACFYYKNDTQIQIAAFMSSVFGLVMIAVIIGAISRILNSSLISPSSFVILTLVLVFFIAGIMHPGELKCLLPGVLYFLTLPAAFVLLNIYAISNLNNISWGTRETVQPKLIERNIKRKSGFVSKYFGKMFANPKDETDLEALRSSLNNLETKLNMASSDQLTNIIVDIPLESVNETSTQWIDHECLKSCPVLLLSELETRFFDDLISTHLYPLGKEVRQEQITEDLKKLRNNSFFAFFMLNALWISLLFTIQLLNAQLKDKIFIEISIGSTSPIKYEPVSFIYVMLFVVILLMQFVAMLWHRGITFMQLIRKTSLRPHFSKTRIAGLFGWCCRKKQVFPVTAKSNYYTEQQF